MRLYKLDLRRHQSEHARPTASGGFNARFDDFPCCYGMAISSNNAPTQVKVPDVTALVTTSRRAGFYAAGCEMPMRAAMSTTSH
jgi:hypothetical protein